MPRNIFARVKPEYVPPIRFTAAERDALLSLLRETLPLRDDRPPCLHLRMAFGRLLLGDTMNAAEARAALGPRWYASPTGRKLNGRDPDETPVTPRRYAEAEERAIAARWFTETSRTAKLIPGNPGGPSPERVGAEIEAAADEGQTMSLDLDRAAEKRRVLDRYVPGWREARYPSGRLCYASDGVFMTDSDPQVRSNFDDVDE